MRASTSTNALTAGTSTNALTAGAAALLPAPGPRPLRPPDARRWLQLGLAACWLLDGMLQFQSFMFSHGFSQMLASAGAGDPAAVAGPVTWVARLFGDHPAATNVPFAAGQVLIGLGIANRRSVRPALAASIVWALGVWWLGEGLGGVLSGGSPVGGAPGAVILYALLAVLLWPATGGRTSDSRRTVFVAAQAVGPAVAGAAWMILWGSLAYLEVAAPNRTPQGLHDLLAGLADGEPGWLAAVNRGLARLAAGHGLAAAIVLAVLFCVIAAGLLLPMPARRAIVLLAAITQNSTASTIAVLFCVIAAGLLLPMPARRAIVLLAAALSLLIWVGGQDFGTILAGRATDPNSGPLLALIAAAFWPGRARTGRPPDAQEEPAC